MGYIDTAVNWAVQIANDGSYAYVWGGWGKSDGGYDCGHFVIDAYTKAGIDIKGAGATFTGDMPKAFMQCGFQNVTGSVNLSTGAGMRKGDVLVNSAKHAALVQRDGGITVEAWCSKCGIVADKAYRNDGWDYVLRYPENGESGGLKPQREEVISAPSGLGKYYTYMNWNTVTNMDTAQGRLIQAAGKHYDSNGYGIVGNRYALAMTSTFGKIGDYVDVYMSDGRIIHGILADEKSQVYCSWDHNPANKWGHDNGQCIVEWVTNWKGHDNPPSNGSVLKVVNLGNYFEYPEYASSTESYMYSANAYGDEKEAVVVWNNRVKENIHKRLQDLPPIPPQEKLTLFANGKDITEIAGNLAWKNSLYELATSMSFETAKTDAAYLKDLIYVPQVGDIIRMATNAEIFRGVITEVDDGDKDSNKYTIHDLGWYLNKTTQTYQFKNITAADAIKELCDDLVISLVMLPELTTNINQIYFDKTISSILSDILEKCGGGYNYDFVPEGLRVYKVGELVAYPEFRVASNVMKGFSPEYKGNMSHSSSMEEMFNSVKVTSEKDNVYTELVVKQNRELIDNYGFLQKVIKIDPEKESAEMVAQKTLDESSRLKENYSFEIIEMYDSYTRAGEVIELDGIRYVIESTDHSFKDGWHFDKLELKKLN